MVLFATALLSVGCERKPRPGDDSPSTSAMPAPSDSAGATFVGSTDTTLAASSPTASTSSSTASLPSATPPRTNATLIAAGDACFGRLVGQEVIKDPSFDPFASSAPLLASVDIRFVNLESQLSDQKGETQSPTQKLVFTGPPGGADALARAKIDIVSLANNHMWDYGRTAFFETIDNLERAGVKYAGAGRTRERAYAPEIVDVGGFRVAFLAFTDIWNQGALKFHPGKDHVAEAQRAEVVAGVKAARERKDVDAVVVSYHGGEEYVMAPLQRAIDLHHATIDAGADVVLGHHPHVVQGIEIYRGKPIYYSLGNYVMRTHGTHFETETGFFAKIAFSRGAAPRAWVCPFRIAGLIPKPILLATDPRKELYERIFRQRVRVVQGRIVNPAQVGPTDEEGCAMVTSSSSSK